MPDIKTRDVVKGTIKTLDRSAVLGERMKEAYVRTKEKGENAVASSDSSADEYAADQLTGGVEAITHEAIYQIDHRGQKLIRASGNASTKAQTRFRQHRQQQQAEQVRRASQPENGHTELDGIPEIRRDSGTVEPERRTIRLQGRLQNPASSCKIKTRETQTRYHRAIKTRELPKGKAARATAKSTGRTIKTADAAAKTAIKTTQESAEAAKRTAVASIRAARVTAHAARVAAKAAITAAKAVAKATADTVKAIIAGTKALVSAIAAGGWVAVLVIVVICIVGLIVGSCFGIFFSGEDSGTGQSMQTVVREINEEYQDKLEEIKRVNPHDKLEMSGSRAVWPQVLAVYAVKTTSDPDAPMEVASMDDTRKEILTDIFWQMNDISSRTEEVTETVVLETDDGHGNIVETTTTVTQAYLYITVSHKTADEMADQFGFSEEQREQLAALLEDENNMLWVSVLYGIGASDDAIVTVALSQIGNVGGQPYWSWYGFENRVEWCACFVSWCANECGYIDAGIIPKFASCTNGVDWFRERGQWAGNDTQPAPGMIIFFDWDDEDGQDGHSDHVGIVEKVENGRVYTIEGNSGDSCRENSYLLGYYQILGYGVPNY